MISAEVSCNQDLRVGHISFVKITPNVCLKSWKFRKLDKILQNISKWDIISSFFAKKVQISDKFPVYKIHRKYIGKYSTSKIYACYISWKKNLCIRYAIEFYFHPSAMVMTRCSTWTMGLEACRPGAGCTDCPRSCWRCPPWPCGPPSCQHSCRLPPAAIPK